MKQIKQFDTHQQVPMRDENTNRQNKKNIVGFTIRFRTNEL